MMIQKNNTNNKSLIFFQNFFVNASEIAPGRNSGHGKKESRLERVPFTRTKADKNAKYKKTEPDRKQYGPEGDMRTCTGAGRAAKLARVDHCVQPYRPESGTGTCTCTEANAKFEKTVHDAQRPGT